MPIHLSYHIPTIPAASIIKHPPPSSVSDVRHRRRPPPLPPRSGESPPPWHRPGYHQSRAAVGHHAQLLALLTCTVVNGTRGSVVCYVCVACFETHDEFATKRKAKLSLELDLAGMQSLYTCIRLAVRATQIAQHACGGLFCLRFSRARPHCNERPVTHARVRCLLCPRLRLTIPTVYKSTSLHVVQSMLQCILLLQCSYGLGYKDLCRAVAPVACVWPAGPPGAWALAPPAQPRSGPAVIEITLYSCTHLARSRRF